MGLGSFVDGVLGSSPEVQKVAGIGALEPLRGFQDLISGVEQVEVTNPDGSKSFVTRRIPLSPEDRAQRQQISEGITGLLTQAQDLAAINVAAKDARFSPVVDAFTAEQELALEERVSDISSKQEEALAKRGITASTVGTGARTALAGEEIAASQGIQRQGLLLGEDLRNQALNRTLSSLQPFTQQQGFNASLEQAGLNRGQALQSQFAGLEFGRQQANLQNAQFNSNQAFQQSASGTGFITDVIGGVAGAAALGSGLGGGFSSLLGNNLGTSISQGVSPSSLLGAF